MLSHHPAKFGAHRSCESGDVTFFIYHVTTLSNVTRLCRLNSLILSHHPAKFHVHRPQGTGNNSVCNINSNPNSNAKVYKWPNISLDKHALLKRRCVRANQFPFMIKKMSKEILKRSRLRNKFLNTKSYIDRKAYNTRFS